MEWDFEIFIISIKSFYTLYNILYWHFIGMKLNMFAILVMHCFYLFKYNLISASFIIVTGRIYAFKYVFFLSPNNNNGSKRFQHCNLCVSLMFVVTQFNNSKNAKAKIIVHKYFLDNSFFSKELSWFDMLQKFWSKKKRVIKIFNQNLPFITFNLNYNPFLY